MASPADLRAALQVNVTISESYDGDRRRDAGWWPSNFEAARPWVEAFRAMGSEIINPYALSNPPRLSPTVYGQYPLSNSTAKTMASLFGASLVVNGSVAYSCNLRESLYSCSAIASIDMTDGSKRIASIDQTFHSRAKNVDSALQQLRERIAFELEPSVVIARNARHNSLPALVHNPVLRFASMPDADTLVAIRKCIKRVNGVTDVAERFVANGMIALEINPATPPLDDDFTRIVGQLVSNGCEDYQFQIIANSPHGTTLELIKF